jgi:hypothetical protein
MMRALVSRVVLLPLSCAIACSDASGPSSSGDVANPGIANQAGTGAGNTAVAGVTASAGSGGVATDPSAGGSGGQSGGPGGSNSGPTAGETGAAAAPSVDTSNPTTPFDMLPASCRGFEVLGLTHSPGGDKLPNTCAPFHNLHNNPYAIRCVDADPRYDTGWLGDEWCILPPSPELGLQIAISPSDYANPEAGFVLPMGVEVVNNYYENATNAERRHFYRVNLRMRTGSHHILNALIADRSDGWTMERDTGLSQRQFPPALRPDVDRPQGHQVPPENRGHADVLEAKQQFQFNMHNFNFSEEAMLREVWVNIWWKDDSEVTDELVPIAIFGNPLDIFIPPGERAALHYRCDVASDTRIVSLTAHRHASTKRFGVWIERAGGEDEPVYESFDYNEQPTYQYDSVTTNPKPALMAKVDGASSGVLNVGAGDSIHFLCDITNDLPENVASNTTLRFANEVITGEMCILFGSSTGSPLCPAGTRVE